MKRLILLSVVAISFSKAFPNAAQPGIWGAGGTATFSLLFPGDSASFKKVQMAKERIYIQLHKGFAVVKGNYWMYNPTDDTVSIKVGYPVNSYLEGENNNLTQVEFDKLYKLKVLSNGQNKALINEMLTESIHFDDANWYLWNNDFPPNDTTLITVYFLVNTNDAHIREGYDKESKNAFIYLLESGATWKQPIVDGQIAIKLNDGLTIEDIWGANPKTGFSVNEENGILKYEFKNLNPNPNDNIVITYSDRVENFNFETVTQQFETYFQNIDDFSTSSISAYTYTSKTFEEASRVGTKTGTFAVGMMMYLVIYGIPILIGIGVIAILYFLIRKFRNK